MEAFVAIGLALLAPGLMGWKYGLGNGSNYGYVAAVAAGMAILTNVGQPAGFGLFGSFFALKVTIIFAALAVPFTIGAWLRRRITKNG